MTACAGALALALSASSVAAVTAQAPSCVPRALFSSPPQDVVDSYGVLRRSAAPGDRIPSGGRVVAGLGAVMSAFFPSYERQVGQLADGSRFYLLLGAPAHGSALRRCEYAGPSLARPAPRSGALTSTSLVYCLIETVPGAITGDCGPFVSIASGELFFGSEFSPAPSGGLAPDGVAAVRIVYRDGVVVNAPVSGNFFSFMRPPQALRSIEATSRRRVKHIEADHRLSRRQKAKQENALLDSDLRKLDHLAVGQVQWLDPAGSVIRTFSPEVAGNPVVNEGFVIANQTQAIFYPHPHRTKNAQR